MKRLILTLLSILTSVSAAFSAQPDPRSSYDRVWEGENNGNSVSYALKLTPDNIVVQEFNLRGRKWRPANTSSTVPFESESRVSLGDFFEGRVIGGERYCICSILESYDSGRELSYRLCAVRVATGELVDLAFRGKNLDDPSALPGRYLIEGTSNAELLPSEDSLVVGLLASMMDSDDRLKVFPKSLFLTDKTIEWWCDNNPRAFTSAKIIQMPVIDAEASLVSEYVNARKVSGERYSVALLDSRGYSVIVAKKNSSSEYVLAWADSLPVNKSADRYIKSIYFQNENTLAVIYYKGSSMFKYSINLATHAVTR